VNTAQLKKEIMVFVDHDVAFEKMLK